MKDEYDFSKAVRGKFYHKDATFHLPIYLEPEVQNFVDTNTTKQLKIILTVIKSK